MRMPKALAQSHVSQELQSEKETIKRMVYSQSVSLDELNDLIADFNNRWIDAKGHPAMQIGFVQGYENGLPVWETK